MTEREAVLRILLERCEFLLSNIVSEEEPTPFWWWWEHSDWIAHHEELCGSADRLLHAIRVELGSTPIQGQMEDHAISSRDPQSDPRD